MNNRLFPYALVIAFSASLALQRPAHANDMVVLGEVLPSVRGTELADVPVGQAPPAGSSRRVRRGEMRAALRRAGVDPESLRLPASVLVSRAARELSGEELLQIVSGPVTEALAPCDVEDMQAQGRTRVPAGPIDAFIERRPQLRSGRITVMVTLSTEGPEVRVPVSSRVTCPPPAVTSGSAVQMVVRIGAVKATANGVALQSGRTGEMVRVRNSQTSRTVTARVVDAQRVEVMR